MCEADELAGMVNGRDDVVEVRWCCVLNCCCRYPVVDVSTSNHSIPGDGPRHRININPTISIYTVRCLGICCPWRDHIYIT